MMKSKFKQFLIPFVLMMGIYLSTTNLGILWKFQIFEPYIFILFISGLLFGPYGALGASLANFISDIVVGNSPITSMYSLIYSFGTSYLAFKIWYSGLKNENDISKPALNKIYQLSLFLFDIIVCGAIYSVTQGTLSVLIYDSITLPMGNILTIDYFVDFTNFSFIFGIISIWISKRLNFVYTPKISTKTINRKLYSLIFYLLIPFSMVPIILFNISTTTNYFLIGNLIIIGILLYAYLTKPFKYELKEIKKNSISERVITIFLLTTIIIISLGIIITVLTGDNYYFFNKNLIHEINMVTSPLLLFADLLIFIFFIPSYFIIRYLDKHVITPIISFSEIGDYVKENEKIEAEGLLQVYSKYVDEDDEIGTLSQSYTDLIHYTNNYIENIHEIESEKERIKAELDIATKIQASNLPTEAIDNDKFIVHGYSHPAKEVGGDFFDYYELDDDNLAIVIGDASGKGVPAALLATVTQAIIKQILKSERDPSKVLYSINNLLCENNPESMFITLWLGIYNKNTKVLTFSNAGHNPPLIHENDKFEYAVIDTGIVLGVMEDYEFVNEETILSKEIILYTDGITDAHNKTDEMYGEERLLNFFNEFKENINPINPLLKDIHNFTNGAEQFDDMTLLYLKVKK